MTSSISIRNNSQHRTVGIEVVSTLCEPVTLYEIEIPPGKEREFRLTQSQAVRAYERLEVVEAVVIAETPFPAMDVPHSWNPQTVAMGPEHA